MEEKYVCPCGLVCLDCLFYKPEAYEAALGLKRAISETRLDKFLGILAKDEITRSMAGHLNAENGDFAVLFAPFKNMPSFLSTLDALAALQCGKTCREAGGCSMGGGVKECDAVKCVKEKKYSGCWECSDRHTCEKLDFQKKSYGRTIEENFTVIREKGTDSLRPRGDDYYEWQRRLKKR